MTYRRAATIGALLGVTFCTAAMVTDLIQQRRLPHPHVYADRDALLASLRK